jgi:hypothetical protein
MSGGGGLAVELISMAGNGALRWSSPAVRHRPAQWTLPMRPTEATMCDGPRLYSRLRTSPWWMLTGIRCEGPRAMTVAAPCGGPHARTVSSGPAWQTSPTQPSAMAGGVVWTPWAH